MFRKLLALTLVLAATPAFANDMTTEEVLALAGPRTCEFGGFTDRMPRLIGIPIITLDPNILYEYCFKLPRLRRSALGVKTNGLVFLQTSNLGNSSCGTASVFLIKPDRRSIFGPIDQSPRTYASVASSQPAAVLTYTPGVWRVLIRYETGCNKYAINVSW